MIYTASNDQDFLSRVAGVEMVDKALERWEREKTTALDSVVSTLDDIAFRSYKEAIDETDTLKARLAMYKAFLLDDNYYNVAAVRMKGLQKKMLVKNDAENQLLFNKLKAIRRSYSEALEGKNDAIYIQALQEVKALRKNYK
jgi:Tfp pilus assembly protein PilE